MFKVGDKVRYCKAVCYWEGVRLTDPMDQNLVLGNIYTVIGHRGSSDIELENIICSYCVARFELVESAPVTLNNPAIEEYTKTVTVRKIRPVSTIQFGNERLHIKSESRNRVSLITRGTNSSYHMVVNADCLRTIAKQLTEIADVLDESKE